jgi:hypothetical protein
MSSPDKEKKMFKTVLYTVLTVNYISFAGIAGITLSCAIFATQDPAKMGGGGGEPPLRQQSPPHEKNASTGI